MDKLYFLQPPYQIMRHNVVKDNYISTERLKTTLKAFTFNYLDIDDRWYFHGNKRLNVLRELRNKFAILKQDKEQGTVLINHDDFINSLRKIFDDSTKFKKLAKDPTITRLTTVQSYLNTLFKRGEINESDKKAMRPKSAQIARAHGLPKTHKHYERLPKLRPIIDTANTPYYGISKFLSNLLNALTKNEYIVQGSFCAAKRLEKYLKNYLMMATDLLHLTWNRFSRVYL